MIVELSGIRITMGRGGWPVRPGDQARIDAHWASLVARNPRLWNGRVLGTLAPDRPGGIAIGADAVLAATALEGDYADFLAWRDWGFPDIGLRNLFGSALVLSADGALLFGVMSDHTANAGRIYPPGGSLEPRDVAPDGVIDVEGSIGRELEEETGLRAADAERASLLAAFDGPRVSIARVFRFAAEADALAASIRRFIETDEHQELSDVAVVRKAADLPAEICPGYARSLAAHVLGG